ncbi:flippase [Pedobacter frigoris]|uniref:Flippase n=1 Tax=Pedobacter frigoris TaxID=2571272 RepID=A0A4U1CDZ7_9SPHI|nr:flippase [Pedobacter frigoris]TKC05208.1 flippase [Pedobacter frigoris]
MKIPNIPGFDQNAVEKYLKNTGWLMVARVGSLGIKILVGIALANYLLKTQYGMLSYQTAFASFFIAAAALGLDGFVTRELLRNPENKNKLLGTAFILKIIGGVAILPLVYLAYQILTLLKTPETPFSYLLIVSFTGIMQAFNIIDSYFQSRTQAKHIMKVQIAANLISAGVKILLILLNLSLPWFVCALLFDAVLLALGYLYIYQKNADSIVNWKFDGATARHLLSNSWPLAFSAILVSIYMKIDQLMIDQYLGKSALGIYTTVVQLAESWYFIPIAIVTSIFPAIMNAKRDDPERYLKRTQNLYDLMVWISLSLAIFITFTAPFIYRIAYATTPEYWPGAPVLAIHIWAGIFVFLGTASGQILIAEGHVKLSMTRTIVGAVVNIGLNIFWIPKYGIAGAAAATLVAYFSSTFWILMLPKTRPQGIMMLKSLFLITLVQKIKTR